MSCEMCAVRVEFPTMSPVSVSVGTPESLSVTVLPMGVRDLTIPYEGEYEFIPSGEYQTIRIEGEKALHDIIIDPIPTNYGLITWNGSSITVS